MLGKAKVLSPTGHCGRAALISCRRASMCFWVGVWKRPSAVLQSRVAPHRSMREPSCRTLVSVSTYKFDRHVFLKQKLANLTVFFPLKDQLWNKNGAVYLTASLKTRRVTSPSEPPFPHLNIGYKSYMWYIIKARAWIHLLLHVQLMEWFTFLLKKLF